MNTPLSTGDRVAEHYRRVLAAHYTWMLGGDIEATAARQREVLDRLLPDRGVDRGAAVDLGCGSGAQTLALADRGHDPVWAVDTDATLLDELRGHLAHRPAVRPWHVDAVTAVGELPSAGVDVVVCMGDTLLHLPSREAVTALIAGAGRTLRPDGRIVLGYRSLVEELRGTDRFIPVRSDTDRILTCFLEATGPDTIEVHDIVHTRTASGWDTAVSSYPKLRLDPAWVTDGLVAAGLGVEHHERLPSGLWLTVARRP